MLEQEVTTANGVKTVVAESSEGLAQAVAAAEAEPLQVRPDIDNPEHGNMKDEEFMAEANKPVVSEPEVEPELTPEPEVKPTLAATILEKVKRRR